MSSCFCYKPLETPNLGCFGEIALNAGKGDHVEPGDEMLV